MKVTEVKLRILGTGNILAFADVEFDDTLTSKGWRVFKGRDGRDYDLGLPSEPDRKGAKDEKTGETKWWPTIWIDLKTDGGRKMMDHIKDAVFTKYQDTINRGSPPKKEATDNNSYVDDDIPF